MDLRGIVTSSSLEAVIDDLSKINYAIIMNILTNTVY